MFVDPAYSHSAGYREFWAKLNHGTSSRANSKGSAAAAEKFGSKLLTIRSST